MAQGTIKKIVADRGFGFIAGEGRQDVFFHLSSVEGGDFDNLQIGQPVEYEEERGDKGPRATSVRLV